MNNKGIIDMKVHNAIPKEGRINLTNYDKSMDRLDEEYAEDAFDDVDDDYEWDLDELGTEYSEVSHVIPDGESAFYKAIKNGEGW